MTIRTLFNALLNYSADSWVKIIFDGEPKKVGNIIEIKRDIYSSDIEIHVK